MLLRIYTLLLTAISVISLSAQPAVMKDAYAAFAKNDNSACIEFLKKAAADPSTAEDANIALFYLYSELNKENEAFQTFRNYYQTSKNPWPFIRMIYFTSPVFGKTPLSKDRAALLDQMMARQDIPADFLSILYHTKGRNLEAQNKHELARPLYKNNGSLLGWAATGVFDNISQGGYDRNHDPISQPNGKGFTDRNGAKVDWFVIPSYKNSGWVDMEYHFLTGNSVVMAQTFVNSPAERKVFIRFGYAGSVKFWLNDDLIYAEQEEVDLEQSSVIIETTLKKGTNRFLLQLGASEENDMNFMIRLTDEKGRVMNDLKSSPTYSDYPKNPSPGFKVYKPFYLEHFEKMAAAQPENPFYSIFLTKAYTTLDMKNDARKTLGALEKQYDKNSFIKAEMFLVQGRMQNNTAQTKILEWFKANDPNNAISIMLLFDEEMEKENYGKADTLLESYMDAESFDYETYLEKKIRLLFYQQEIIQARKLLDEAYKKFPLENWVVQTQALVKRKIDKNPKAAEKIIKKYLAKKYNSSMYMELAGTYLEEGRVPEGLAIYDKLLKDDPQAIGYYNNLASIYEQLKRYDEAAKYYQKCIDMAPYVGTYYSNLGDVYKETGNTLKAEENYTKALLYNIFDYDTRRKMRVLKGKKEDIFDYFKEVKVYDIIRQAPDKSAYPDDNSVLLVYDVNTVLYKSGAAQQKVVVAAKVFNTAGIDEWKSYSLPYGANLEKAEIVKADGNKIQAESDGSSIVFTNLEAGDAVHIIMRRNFYRRGKLKNHFWDDHYFKLLYPIMHNRYALMAEPGIDFKHQVSNDTLQPVKENRSGFDFYTWERKNTPALKTEKLMGTLTDNSNVLFISTVPDWTFISNWYSDLSRNKVRSDYDVKETVAEIFKGRENVGDEEKARLIYEYIVKNIRYSSESFRQSSQIPQKASTVINTKVGDCKDVSTLFLTMAREVGLKNTRLVLVNTRDNGRNAMPLPCTDFNHCIAAVDLNGKTHFVELTSDKNSFNTMDAYLKGSFALPIYSEAENPGKVEPVYLESELRVKNAVKRSSEVSFDNKDININVTSAKTGGPASSTRATYADVNEDDRRKYMISALSTDKGNVKLNKLEFIRGLDDQTDTVTYRYDYKLMGVLTQITGLNIFTLPWADGVKSVEWVGEEERKFSIDQWRWNGNDYEEETMTINLPAGKKLAEMPKDVHLECQAASYDLKFTVKGQQLIVTRIVKLKMDVLNPSMYQEVKKFWQDVVVEDQKQYAFK